ncbi:MAG: tryptophan synthase subunit alpha [Deltaproteobacteria bacterium]|nr:tryptophan synthase subunit alpha [Deltaproteobacteria bacterium]
MLEPYIRKRLNKKKILVMTHLVMGYPSFEDGYRIIETMVQAGVDIIELQLPNPNPHLDGPVIRKANRVALKKGETVSACLAFAGDVAERWDIPFLVMGYADDFLNIGIPELLSLFSKKKIKGILVPDLPARKEKAYAETVKDKGLSPIFVITPKTSLRRMARLSALGDGFVYCQSRDGVTGNRTLFGPAFEDRISRIRKATPLPLAVGFGLQGRKDVIYLQGKADIAVIGTRLIGIFEKKGRSGLDAFLMGLR